MREVDYCEALLNSITIPNCLNMWLVKGHRIRYCSGYLFPDLEIEALIGRKIVTAAVVELKINRSSSIFQPQLYARLINAPWYCIVDGYQRTPVKWIKNQYFVSAGGIDINAIRKSLDIIGSLVEEFNNRKFL
jgi:hypothetical protein